MTSKTISKNRGWPTRNPPGDPPGTPWEPPQDPGPKIDDSEVDFELYFDSQSMKSETKVSQNQRSERPRRPYPSYIIQFDELNRSRWVPKLDDPLTWLKIDEINHENSILLKIDAQSFPEADSELYYRAWRAESI